MKPKINHTIFLEGMLLSIQNAREKGEKQKEEGMRENYKTYMEGLKSLGYDIIYWEDLLKRIKNERNY